MDVDKIAEALVTVEERPHPASPATATGWRVCVGNSHHHFNLLYNEDSAKKQAAALRLAIVRKLRECLASTAPLVDEDAAALDDAKELILSRHLDISDRELWTAIVYLSNLIGRQQVLIARLMSDEEGAIFEAGREYGKREMAEWLDTVKLEAKPRVVRQ